MGENHSTEDKAAFYAFLAKYNSKPSKGGEEWAQNNWSNLENVMDRINSLEHNIKLKLGRNKNIVCSVLGACLTAAIETHLKQKNQDQIVIESLQNIVEMLQKQLNEERRENYILTNENRFLKTALDKEHACTNKQNDHLKKQRIRKLYISTKSILRKN